MQFVKTISTEIDDLSRRIIKVLRFGKSDVQTSLEGMPFGLDSNPIKNLVAIYAETSEKGKTVIIGYLNKNQLAAVGENRFFSTDENGELKTFIWLKNNGTIEIGGDADNAVRYSPVADSVNEIKNDIATLKQIFAAGWTPIPNDGGAALKAAAATWAGTALTKDIADAKINEIKTP